MLLKRQLEKRYLLHFDTLAERLPVDEPMDVLLTEGLAVTVTE